MSRFVNFGAWWINFVLIMEKMSQKWNQYHPLILYSGIFLLLFLDSLNYLHFNSNIRNLLNQYVRTAITTLLLLVSLLNNLIERWIKASSYVSLALQALSMHLT